MSEPASRYVNVNGFKLHYWEWPGQGRAIVFLHPSGFYGRIWEWVAEDLSPDFRVLALDQRGHGDSTVPADGGSAADHYAGDVEAFAQAVGLDRFDLGGHSLGARGGMVYAALHPERLHTLLLVGGPHYSTIHPGADVEYWQNNSNSMRVRAKRYDSAEGPRAILRASYPQFTDAAIEHCVRHNTNTLPDGWVEWKYDPPFVADGLTHALDDLRPHAAKVACPTLILRAEKSWELTDERMPEVQGLFPTGQTITIPGARANLELEASHEVAAHIRNFLTGAL